VSSSKRARLHRRQAARRRVYKRLRKSGRVPQHTRAERRLAEVERQRQREAERSRQARLRRETFPVLATTAAASIIALIPAEVSGNHSGYPFISAAALAGPGRPDLPHQPEPDMTFDTPWAGPGGTAVASAVGPAGPGHLDGWERYGSYGPNVFGY
jgi:hypothetical protein